MSDTNNSWILSSILRRGEIKILIKPLSLRVDLKNNKNSEDVAQYTYLKFILFCNNTVRASDGLSVQHQESKTVHTASGICHEGFVAAC